MAIRPLDPGISSGGGSSGGGSLSMKSKSVAVNTSVTAADSGKIITTTASGITLTLAAVAGLGDGFTLVVKNTSTGDITVATSGSDKIDGASTFVIPASEVALIQGDSTALQVVVLSTLKMARLPILQDNGTWNAVSSFESLPYVKMGFSTSWGAKRIAYGSGVYVVTSLYSLNNVYSSPDLLTWTIRTLTTTGYRTIGSSGSQFLAYDYGTTNVHISNNGTTWTKCTALPATIAAETVPIKVGGLWLIYGATTTYYTSADGVAWTTRTLPGIPGQIYSIGSTNSLAWFSVSSSTNAYYTTDGINWVLASLPVSSTNFSSNPSIYDDGYLYWERADVMKLYRTTDGINWADTGVSLPSDYSTGCGVRRVNGCYMCYTSTAPATQQTYSNGAWTKRVVALSRANFFAEQPQVSLYSSNGYSLFSESKTLLLGTTASEPIYELLTGTSGSYGLFVK